MFRFSRTVLTALSGTEASAATRVLQGLQYKCRFSRISMMQTQTVVPQQVCSCRWYAYYVHRPARHSINKWEKKEKQNEDINFESLCSTAIGNLERYRYMRSMHMSKIFDRVHTAEDLALAEKVLTCFRRGLSKPQKSLPLVVVRACIRVGNPRRALDFVSNKVQYGVFPSPNVYNVLMDSLLEHSDPEGALAAYEQLLTDELKPNGTTHFLAAVAQAELGTPEGLEQALTSCQQCARSNRTLGERAGSAVIKSLVQQKQTEKALELTHQLLTEGFLSVQLAFNIKVHVQIAAGDYASAIANLEAELCSHGKQRLRMPTTEFLQLQQTVEKTEDEALRESMKELIDKLQSGGLLPSNKQNPSSNHSHSDIKSSPQANNYISQDNSDIESSPQANSDIESSPQANSDIESSPQANSDIESSPQANSDIESSPQANSDTGKPAS